MRVLSLPAATVRTGIVALAALLLLGGSRGAAVGDVPTVLRIATLPIDTGAEAFYAEDMGFFKKAGFDVQITVTQNGAALAAAVAGGTFDIGQTNVPALAAAREHGLPFLIIAPSSVYTQRTKATAAIMVGKDTNIKTARDLNGKTIAVSGLLGIGQVTTAQWIDVNGGDSSTVKWIEMPFSAMSAAMTTGRADAVETAYPAIEEALADGHRLLDPGYEAVAPEFAIGSWFTTSAFVKAHPDVVRRFYDVIRETARWANTHHAESAAILAKWSKQEVPPTMPRVYYGEHLALSEVQPIIDVSYKYHALAGPLPASELVAADVLR